MNSTDELFLQTSVNFRKLGLTQSPFTESPIEPQSKRQSKTLNHIFTGRRDELIQVFSLLQSRERRRILISGRIGIGKSAFLHEVLSALSRNRPKMLTVYTSLPDKQDLATTALIALAQAMPNDEWAQQQLYQMGIPIDRVLKERTTKAGIKMVAEAELSEKDLPFTKSQHPTVSLDKLIERAQKQYGDGVLIAIDDLDKQDPSTVRKLMHDAQGMLKGRAWFLLTGHPMTGDLLTSERGLFDLQLELKELDQPTTYQMLINYLNSVRIKNDCKDINDPRSVLPFLPETAKKFCEVSLGKPRLFNRLGSTVLLTAANLQVEVITQDVLEKGLKAAAPSLKAQAALSFQEERIRALLQKRGIFSEDITMEDLQELGVRTFSELLPILERLEEADLAHQINQGDTKAFAPIPLPESQTPSVNDD
ncbi:MAG: ATP-binding protein [Pseudanabaenaceae cyanobacterium bins.39]|nr:ATP-binding protein [Pseudanabaenaceae cyanobacterium bins.39]